MEPNKMNPLDQKIIDKIKVAHTGRSKMWNGGLLTPQENAAMTELQGVDVVGILLDRSDIQTEILKQVQFRLRHIAENIECIGLEMAHVDGNCLHCLAKADFKINLGGLNGEYGVEKGRRGSNESNLGSQ